MKTIVVIPNWNGKEWLSECLDSLLAQTLKTQVLVVDNGSTDGSVGTVEQDYPSVRLIKLANNIGFAGGVNKGIEYALDENFDAVALFNNDAKAKTDWLEELVSSLSDKSEVGIVTCKLLHTDKKHFDSTGDYYYVWGLPFPRGREELDSGQFNKEEFVFSASGGASLYRASMLREIGLFDERYFAYFEDVDMGFRAQLAGWKILYNPRSIAYHRISATSSKLGNFAFYHSAKNFYFLYIKNMPGWLFWKYLPRFLFRALRMVASSIKRRRLPIQLRAMLTVLLDLPRLLSDRHYIQSNRKVSTTYIDSMLVKSKVN